MPRSRVRVPVLAVVLPGTVALRSLGVPNADAVGVELPAERTAARTAATVAAAETRQRPG